MGALGEACGPTRPSVPCSRMPKKQARLRATGDAGLLEGVPPQERTRVLTEAMIRRKEERCKNTRCPRCWFPTDSSGTSYCVCSRMPPLAFTTRTRFLVYMHPRDWYNAGDDAKILVSAAPGAAEVFVFGRPGDDARLRDALEEAEATVLLFPDAAAVTVGEFLASRQQGAAGAVAPVGPPAASPQLSIVVIDGTWNNVKQMVKHFSRAVGPGTPHVKLEPTSLSVYARTQTRADGVSSVEAVALLLRELGETEEVCDSLVRYIEINNEALKLRPSLCGEGEEGDVGDGCGNTACLPQAAGDRDARGAEDGRCCVRVSTMVTLAFGVLLARSRLKEGLQGNTKKRRERK